MSLSQFQTRAQQEILQKIQGSLDDLERARGWIQSIERAVGALSGATSTQSALQGVLEAALVGTHTTIGSVALRDAPGHPLIVECRREGEDTLLDRAREDLEHRHFLWVVERGRPLLLSPPGVPVQLTEIHHEHFQAGNFLLVPIMPTLEMGGVLCVGTLQRRQVFRPEDLRFLTMIGTLAAGTLRNMRAVEEVHHFLMATIRSLCAALDARDPYTAGHSERVAMFALAVLNEYEAMRGKPLPENFRDSLRLGAMLHDVGKIGISDTILHKPDQLTTEEFEIMKVHPEKGAAIVSGVRNIGDIVHAIRHHHERWDGTGYPDRLRGGAIPLIARIVGIADSFDAITSDRPYRKGTSPESALELIRKQAGRSYDPEIVAALERAFAMGSLNIMLDTGAATRTPEENRIVERLFDSDIRELPSMPQVVHHVIEKTRDANCSVRTLAEVVSRDQGLVSRILRLVNSAFYGFSRRIATVNLALTILGLRNVRNLVINVGLAGFFRGGSNASRESRLRLWEHSVETAVGAMTLARLRKMAEPDEAFTAGLLHDIGRIALDYHHHDLAARVESLVNEEGLDPLQAEERVLGVDHGVIGSWVASRWNLPGALCDAIRYHHDPERCALEAPGSLELAYLVGAAEALSELRHEVQDETQMHLLNGSVTHLALTREEIQAALEAMEREKEAMMQVLGNAA